MVLELVLISAKLVSVVRQIQSLIKAVHRYDDYLKESVIAHADYKKLLKLEGVGTMNAINLYIALGCWDIGVFTKGKDASACIGLTPIQHSSGALLERRGKKCAVVALANKTVITAYVMLIKGTEYKAELLAA